jgi:hypothetical protein
MAHLGRKILYTIFTTFLGIFLVFPGFILALFTSLVSFWILSLMILYKGLSAIWRSIQFCWSGPDPRNSPEAIARRERIAAEAAAEATARRERVAAEEAAEERRIAQNSASQASASNTTTRSNSNLSLQIDRDYEGTHIPSNSSSEKTKLTTHPGVGGWYIPPLDPTAVTSYATSTASTSSSDEDIPSAPTSPPNRNRPPNATGSPPTPFRRRSFGASSAGINALVLGVRRE